MRSKKAAKNIIVSLLQQIVTIVCGFIAPKLIIQSFGSSINGLVSSITQFLAYITLLESGIGPVIKSALYKPIAKKDKNQIANILKAAEKFFRIISYIFIIYIIFLSIFYPVLMGKEFEIWFTVSLVLIISISTFVEYFFGMTYRLFLQAEQKTYIVSVIQTGTTILNTISVVLLIKVGASIQIVKLVSSLIFIFRPILQNLYVRKKYNINFKEIDNQYKLKQKWDGLAQHVAAIVHTNADIAILTIFSTLKEVSVYSVYMLVVNGVKNLIQAFCTGIDASFGNMIAKDEKENLNRSFRIYELFYFSITTVVFICTIILIVPFIELYTNGITDVNYSRKLFAFLIVIAEFMHSIRLPYSSITLAAGHFKETLKGAWFEAGINIVLSIILVINFGIVGVAIGTFVAMFIRTIEFMYHSSKYILDRSVKFTFKRLLVILIEVILVILICEIIPIVKIINYLTWIVNAIIVAIITSIVVLGINFIVYKDDFKGVLNTAIRILNLKKNRENRCR